MVQKLTIIFPLPLPNHLNSIPHIFSACHITQTHLHENTNHKHKLNKKNNSVRNIAFASSIPFPPVSLPHTIFSVPTTHCVQIPNNGVTHGFKIPTAPHPFHLRLISRKPRMRPRRRRRREQDQHADNGHHYGGDREGLFHWVRFAGDIFQVL